MNQQTQTQTQALPNQPPSNQHQSQVQPRPADEDLFVWHADLPARVNYEALGKRLAESGLFFRHPEPKGGLIQIVPPHWEPRLITNGKQFLPYLYDVLNVVVATGEQFTGRAIPKTHLDALLHSQIFLKFFHVVSQVTALPRYLPDFSLTQPGHNVIDSNAAIFYTGPPPQVSQTFDSISRFLDVMDFESDADRTNTVAAGLTILLRNHFHGGKPIILATATKSHAGKDTLIDFAAGLERKVSISYQGTDWALERSFVGAFNSSPNLGVLVLENARLYGRADKISSGFIERFATDPNPMLYSTNTGEPVHIANDIVLALSTNYGEVSEDILNRSLPIHLAPNGSVEDRPCPIGNPKLEYLPAHENQIAAEFRGMIERWKLQGCPHDLDVRHPFSLWAKTIGGILLANGFQDFLANYKKRKVVTDPVREALGFLGASAPNVWLRTDAWVFQTEILGLVHKLIPRAERESTESMRRRLGIVLSAHENETVIAELEDGIVTMRLDKARRRFDPGQQPHTRYRFTIIDSTAFPEDP